MADKPDWNKPYWNKLLSIYHKFNKDNSLWKSVKKQMEMRARPQFGSVDAYLKWRRANFLLSIQKVLSKMDCVHFIYEKPFHPIDVYVDGEEFIIQNRMQDEYREQDHPRDPKTGRYIKKGMIGAEEGQSENVEAEQQTAQAGDGYKDGWENEIPKEHHITFQALNEVKYPCEYIASDELDRLEMGVSDLLERDENGCNQGVFKRLDNCEYNGDVIDYAVDTSNLNPMMEFLHSYTLNRDLCMEDYEEVAEENMRVIKKMIEASPPIQGEVWRGEVLRKGQDLQIGGTVSFDMRSVADDNAGYEVVTEFMQDNFEDGDDVVYYKFPKGIRGLNMQGISMYPNQHEYLISGDFVVKNIEEDEFGCKSVELDFIPRKNDRE